MLTYDFIAEDSFSLLSCQETTYSLSVEGAQMFGRML